jgi:hypothetical protein
MKTKLTLAIVAVVAIASAPLIAQTKPSPTNDPYTLDLLRRTLEEQKKNPGKVVRTPDGTPSTNAAKAAPLPAAPSSPAVAQGPAPSGKSPEVLELERQYLEGKISAKQFQKSLEKALEKAAEQKAAARSAAASTPKPAITPATSPKAAAAAGTTAAAPQPAFPTPPPQPNPNQKKLSEVEMRIDEMIRKRAEREKAAREAAAAAAITNNPSGAPPTKRQRLDALLRQVVEGKMTDAEYRAQRDKIAAEPE